MTQRQLKREAPSGLYCLYWKDGGGSLAAVGQDARGRFWFAPTDWSEVPSYNWRLVERLVLIAMHP